MLIRWLYFRLFGLTALIATAAYWMQMPGLASSRGLWPIAQSVDWLRTRVVFLDVPTLCWLSSSDHMLQGLCGVAVVCSLLVMFDVAVPAALVGLFVSWMSLVNVGQPFLSFQWDIMLCEAALLSVGYALRPRAEPQLWQRHLVALVAVKVTVESGIVKLTAGDAAWWPDLTALTYHYWTQPLPAWTSAWLDQLPLQVHQASCLAMFLLELGVPLLAFGTRRARAVAAVGMIALQVGLALAGNYSYFNLLTAVLCLPLFDDSLLHGIDRSSAAAAWVGRAGWSSFGVVALLSVLIFAEQYGPEYPQPVRALIERVEAFKAVSAYGVFRVMTKTRPEIEVEGSADGVTWAPYEFKWKPGRVDRRPQYVAPYQPRLDWQMWFAALGDCANNPWFLMLMKHLLQGTPEVSQLMGENPFPTGPPRFVRSTVWQYRFASAADPAWWVRADPKPYCPTVTLGPDGQLTRAP